MPLDKTLTDVYRHKLDLDKYHVFEALPGHFDTKYPKLVNFLQEYYKTLEEEGAATEALNDLLLNRDVTGAKVELLDFIANELLMGKPYYESFSDKRTSLQYSNLLYRSKGTEFSIKQFFRVFYGLDIEVRYGKDEVFYVGDPNREVMIFEGGGQSTGFNFPYTFRGSEIFVYLQDSQGEYVTLRQDVDYIREFSRSNIRLQPVDSAGLYLNPLTAASFDSADNPIYDSDSRLTYFGKTGYVPDGSSLKIESVRRSYSTIGTEVTLKRITDNKFYQLYGILISTPIGVPVWREAYKTFVHPAGMYLAGQVQINSIYDFNLGPQPSFIEPPPPIEVFSTAQVLKRNGRGLFTTSLSEIGPGPYGERIRTRVNDMFHPRNVAGWHTQYGSIYQADLIEARTLDDTYADLSNSINLLDEGKWYSYDSDGSGNRANIKFPITLDSGNNPIQWFIDELDTMRDNDAGLPKPRTLRNAYVNGDSDGRGNTSALGLNAPNLIQYVEFPLLPIDSDGTIHNPSGTS